MLRYIVCFGSLTMAMGTSALVNHKWDRVTYHLSRGIARIYAHKPTIIIFSYFMP